MLGENSFYFFNLHFVDDQLFIVGIFFMKLYLFLVEVLINIAAISILIIWWIIWLACFCYYFLRFFQSLQYLQLLFNRLFLNKITLTSFAGLPNFSLKYSSRVLFDRLLTLIELMFRREAVDLFAWLAIFSLLTISWVENSSSWLFEVQLGNWEILFFTIS